jgi:DNA primase
MNATAGNRGSHNRKLSVDNIKRAISPLDFFHYELPTAQLKNPGWNDGGLCPFHADTKAGSFRVNLETGGFVCFACGVKGGDIIAFVMALHGLNFVEALAKLADEWGLS